MFTHETETVYHFPLRFNMASLSRASDYTEIAVEVNEGAGFRQTVCNAGHVRACVRTYGVRKVS